MSSEPASTGETPRQLLTPAHVPAGQGYRAWHGGLLGSGPLLVCSLVVERANQGTAEAPQFLVEPPVTRIPLTVDVDLVASDTEEDTRIPLQSATLGGAATGALKALFSGTADQPVSGWRLRIRCAPFGIDYHSDPLR